MLLQLASHNDDLRRLIDKGYALKLDSEYLVVRDVPYLDQGRALKIGAMVMKVVYLDQQHVKPDDHQIFFCGSHPHNIDGTPVPNLGGGAAQLTLLDKSLVVERTFSNKPADGFPNFFEKIESYTRIISGPAFELFRKTPYTYRCDKVASADSVFKIHDTLTSRAELGDLNARLKDDVVAIIGLGGTGAYILDFLVRAPVKEIRAFDSDVFYVHNAFRSPGRMSDDEFTKSKAEIYQRRYENFRSGLAIKEKALDESCSEDIQGVTFAFVCVDKGSSRGRIFELLLSKRIPFVDVGMGLDRKTGPIGGQLRVTYYSAENGADMQRKGLADTSDDSDDVYRTNIQISELNALNAALAVARYKQARAFYADDGSPEHLVLCLDDLRVYRETR